ncbi:hypothetical protein [Salinarimonas chemoclinalis]|uniref:hypothetical protein n=1 Tax=Salinarimonas chemoclinalis TaxID=3241599 RepID=UPI0035588785
MTKRREKQLDGPWVAHSLEMRESPAWHALTDNARRVLDRMEVEHMSQGAVENGRLICTYDQLEAAGIRRKSIALAVRQCIALGFVEITEAGGRSISGLRRPTRYRLTYVINRRRPGELRAAVPTHEWRKIASRNEAEAALASVLHERNHGTQPVRRNQNTGGGSATRTGGGSAPGEAPSPGAVAPLQARGR